MHTESEPEASTPPPPPHAALFLDFDGTLVPIAPRPQDVIVPGGLVPTLESLNHRLGGALAIVSGRPLASIDAFLHPLVLAAAGAHGAERRGAGGRIERHASVPPAAVVACAERLAAQHAGLICELKPSGMALHFRQRPELEAMCTQVLAQALADAEAQPPTRWHAQAEAPGVGVGVGVGVAPAWELLHGHCVCELKQRAVSKGMAVRAFLAEPAFEGRVPVFVGDDVTDEDGIRAVQAAGGFGIHVGPGATEALHRLADTRAVAAWLQAAAQA